VLWYRVAVDRSGLYLPRYVHVSLSFDWANFFPALTRNQLPSFRIKHHFSAEIDAVKQGFIERNFSPEKLFRDVREFLHDDAKFATTAYGAQASIPGNIDILVAGFVCKDISLMNNHKKDLFEDDGESGDTWRAIYSYAKQFTPSIVLIENVTGRKAYWDRLVLKWSQIGYESAWVICDSKRHYLSQTRQRMYMIALNRNLYGKNAAKAVGEWKSLMMKLQRQCSSPYEAFLTGLSQDPIDYNALPSEHDWALCKLRYDHIRADQRLGIMRPVTQWSENGTLRYLVL
jgi:site-specific DNA-cytosine methylase